ncbi:MAG: hypothetical protein M3308_11620 [Actinomycetota bacterium]|nr:hypothetical protein [Actinomycetota bacterium]
MVERLLNGRPEVRVMSRTPRAADGNERHAGRRGPAVRARGPGGGGGRSTPVRWPTGSPISPISPPVSRLAGYRPT